MSDITAWRIVRERHAATAFSGEGAKREGGRWNSEGTPVVYVAESRSLAALEMLVNLEDDELLRHYRLVPATFSRMFVKELSAAELPASWKRSPPPLSTQSIGDKRIASAESVVLRLPSAVMPAESNFLLNPAHRDFRKVELGLPQPFRFDRRLK